MTATRYKEIRSMLGTQHAVARALRTSRSTIAKREAGTVVITPAAELAMTTLHLLQVNPKQVEANRTRNAESVISRRPPTPIEAKPDIPKPKKASKPRKGASK